MFTSRNAFIAMLSLCLAAGYVRADPIVYTINSGTATTLASSGNTIALGTLTQDTLIHIYDPATTPSPATPTVSNPPADTNWLC